MPPPPLTPFSLAAAVAYLVAAAFALGLVIGPARARLDRPARGHWFVVAMIFVSLAAWRIGQGEIRIQDDLRTWAQLHGTYGERRPGQAVLTLVLLAFAGIGCWSIASRGLPRRSLLALLMAMAMVLLAAVRLVSLHAIDALLYHVGPFHLNYVLDLGLTAGCVLVAICEIVGHGLPHHGKARR